MWRGVDNARNVLVEEGAFYPKWAIFHHFSCENLDDCYGGSDAPKPLQELKDQSLTCTESNIEGIGKACRFDDPNGNWKWYNSWLYIQIVPDGESRPVYGILVKFSSYYNGNDFTIYIHDVNKGWFEPSWDRFAPKRGVIKPSSSWSWDADAILIGGWVGSDDDAKDLRPSIGYVGLITSFNRSEMRYFKQVPFCTDRPREVNDESKFFYRTVDNGVKCYWNLNCREKEVSGKKGWYYEGPSSGIEPIKGLEVCSCSESQYGNVAKRKNRGLFKMHYLTYARNSL